MDRNSQECIGALAGCTIQQIKSVGQAQDENHRAPPSSPNLMEEDTEAQRFCYCDNVQDDRMKEDDDWIECSHCEQWYHLPCTGWKREDDNGCQYLVAPFEHQVLVDGSSDNPWFCIRCWELQKAPCLPFHLCELEEKVLCLGCTIDEKIT